MGRVYYIKDRDGWFYDTTGVWHMPSEMFNVLCSYGVLFSRSSTGCSSQPKRGFSL